MIARLYFIFEYLFALSAVLTNVYVYCLCLGGYVYKCSWPAVAGFFSCKAYFPRTKRIERIDTFYIPAGFILVKASRKNLAGFYCLAP